VRILHRRKLESIDDEAARAREETALVAEYEDRFLNPYVAAERGYVDDVIPASDTRRSLTAALARLATKAEHQPRRRHSNTPL
jgi:propionyl-CoA carboxylase beta chain